jgi:hypothetical protein
MHTYPLGNTLDKEKRGEKKRAFNLMKTIKHQVRTRY